MPEYKVIGPIVVPDLLQSSLNQLAGEGWKPILMSDAQASTQAVVSVTVVLEKTAANQNALRDARRRGWSRALLARRALHALDPDDHHSSFVGVPDGRSNLPFFLRALQPFIGPRSIALVVSAERSFGVSGHGLSPVAIISHAFRRSSRFCQASRSRAGHHGPQTRRVERVHHEYSPST